MRRLPPVEDDQIRVAAQPAAASWREAIYHPLRGTPRLAAIALDALILRTLEHSSQVRVFRQLPVVRQPTVIEAEAAFDWQTFVEANWNDLSDPVGSLLTTGGPPRFLDRQSSATAGVRRKNRLGGTLELGQDAGLRTTNSNFFVPREQGATRLTMSYSQPLLRGAGRHYNESITVLAELDTGIAHDELIRQLQTHLLEVARAFWALYLERGALAQQQQYTAAAVDIQQRLRHRTGVDAMQTQLMRVDAAVAERQAALLRARMSVRVAEARLCTLVGDPTLNGTPRPELVPQDAPLTDAFPVDLAGQLRLALRQRPEVAQSLKQIRAAAVKLDVAKEDLLPKLDLVLETYASGLEGDYDLGQSFADQFGRGRPSYSVGFVYERPLANRAAAARHHRRHEEMIQLQHQLQTTVQTLSLEVETAVEEVQTSFGEIAAKETAARAARAHVEHLEYRWSLLPSEHRSAGLYLEDLLAAQERLYSSEYGVLRATSAYNLALINLRRATGVLFQEHCAL